MIDVVAAGPDAVPTDADSAAALLTNFAAAAAADSAVGVPGLSLWSRWTIDGRSGVVVALGKHSVSIVFDSTQMLPLAFDTFRSNTETHVPQKFDDLGDRPIMFVFMDRKEVRDGDEIRKVKLPAGYLRTCLMPDGGRWPLPEKREGWVMYEEYVPVDPTDEKACASPLPFSLCAGDVIAVDVPWLCVSANSERGDQEVGRLLGIVVGGFQNSTKAAQEYLRSAPARPSPHPFAPFTLPGSLCSLHLPRLPLLPSPSQAPFAPFTLPGCLN